MLALCGDQKDCETEPTRAFASLRDRFARLFTRSSHRCPRRDQLYRNLHASHPPVDGST